MHRLFPAFPSGLPGLTLLLLRVTLGATVINYGGTYLWARQNMATWSWVIGAGALVVVGASLIIGFLTPINATIASIAGLATAILLFSAAGDNALHFVLFAFYVFITALVGAFLGPGAYSLDARLFGRREIIIPEKPNQPKF